VKVNSQIQQRKLMKTKKSYHSSFENVTVLCPVKPFAHLPFILRGRLDPSGIIVAQKLALYVKIYLFLSRSYSLTLRVSRIKSPSYPNRKTIPTYNCLIA
jgi:hypothetical protein